MVIEFRDAKVVDHSAVEAIDSLAARYSHEGKTLHLRHLSPDCLELLEKAKEMVEVNEFEDPHYHIADNKLSFCSQPVTAGFFYGVAPLKCLPLHFECRTEWPDRIHRNGVFLISLQYFKYCCIVAAWKKI